MKVGVAVWEGRISPVFDSARHVHVYEINEAGAPTRLAELSMQGVHPAQRVRILQEAGIEVLICGAVSNPLGNALQHAGIHLLPFVTGSEEEVLAAFWRGDLPSDAYLQPGCCRRARRGAGGRGAGRGTGGGCGSGRGRGRGCISEEPDRDLDAPE